MLIRTVDPGVRIRLEDRVESRRRRLVGLDPAPVGGIMVQPDISSSLPSIHDTQHRRWVVRAPRSGAAGAQMDVSVSPFSLLSRRLPFSVPTSQGFVALKRAAEPWSTPS